MNRLTLPVLFVGLLIALVACDDPVPTFTIAADQIAGGVLLGATSDGEQAIFVGGHLGGGTGTIATLKGDELCVQEAASDRALWWIHSARPGEWYAVGEAGTIIHSVDGVRTDESVTTDAILYGVWDAGDRVIAVGGDLRGTGEGEVWVREGGTWSQFVGGLPGVIFKIWDKWLVGKGVAYHLEGDTLVERFPPVADTTLLTVVGRSDEDVWAVGGLTSPTILHWNGASWDSIEIDLACQSNNGLNGVWTKPDESIWIAGFFGSMGEHKGDGEWNCPKEPPTYEHFHAVVKHGDEVLWAGGNLFEVGNNYGTLGRFGTSTTELKVTSCP